MFYIGYGRKDGRGHGGYGTNFNADYNRICSYICISSVFAYDREHDQYDVNIINAGEKNLLAV